MNLDGLERKKHAERITEWVSGGSYAVAVEVEAVFLPDRPNEPFLTPETIRYLEKIEALAAAGDVEALRKVGRLYVQHERAASMTSP
jgi:hypothetical protein